MRTAGHTLYRPTWSHEWSHDEPTCEMGTWPRDRAPLSQPRNHSPDSCGVVLPDSRLKPMESWAVSGLCRSMVRL